MTGTCNIRKDDIMDRKAHFFYALRLPMEAKLLIRDQLTELKQHFHFSRWVHHEDYHITLAFLGNADSRKLDDSVDFVQKALAEEHIFPLTIHELGVFGKKDSPRIFWAGVREEKRLHEIRNLVYQACTTAGFKLETRPFHPHITVARKWSGENLFPNDFMKKNPFSDHPIELKASEVVLYQTYLDREPKYEAINIFPLKG